MKIRYARFVKTVNVLALKKKIWNSIEDNDKLAKTEADGEDKNDDKKIFESEDGASPKKEEAKPFSGEKTTTDDRTFTTVLKGLDGELQVGKLTHSHSHTHTLSRSYTLEQLIKLIIKQKRILIFSLTKNIMCDNPLLK